MFAKEPETRAKEQSVTYSSAWESAISLKSWDETCFRAEIDLQINHRKKDNTARKSAEATQTSTREGNSALIIFRKLQTGTSRCRNGFVLKAWEQSRLQSSNQLKCRSANAEKHSISLLSTRIRDTRSELIENFELVLPWLQHLSFLLPLTQWTHLWKLVSSYEPLMLLGCGECESCCAELLCFDAKLLWRLMSWPSTPTPCVLLDA